MSLSGSDKSVYHRNARIYRLLASPVRLELLNTLRQSTEISVDDLSETVGLQKSNVSQHLSRLRDVGLVKSRREGQHIYYRLSHKDVVSPCQTLKRLWDTGAFCMDERGV